VTLPTSLSFREVLQIDVMRRVWYAQVISLFGDFLDRAQLRVDLLRAGAGGDDSQSRPQPGAAHRKLADADRILLHLGRSAEPPAAVGAVG
jgi:hypothetical protein